MTRYEKIINDAKEYYSDNIKCYDAFLHGVEWADQHPNLESIWHDASEEPLYNEEIIYQDEDNYVFITDIEDKEFYENGWKGLIKMDCVVRWAYVKDILPNTLKTFYRKELKNEND